MTAPNGHAELIPFKPGAPEPQALAPAAWTGGAMAGWTHTRTLEQVERYEPITPAAIPPNNISCPFPSPLPASAASPWLARAVANGELALRGVLVASAALVVILILVHVVGWLA